MRRSLVILCTVAASGCYKYVAKEATAITPNTEVSIDLSPLGSDRVRHAIGDGVTVVDGRLAEMDSSGLTVSLITVHRRFDAASSWNGESLRLATGDYNRVREKQLSRGRTTAAAVSFSAIGVGLMVAIAKATGVLWASGSGKGPSPPP